jgi:hypothetical protein
MLKSLAAIALIGLTIVIGASANVAAAAGTPDYKGTVTAVSTSILSIRTDKGKTHTFRLSAATTVEKLGNKTTLADVKPGAVAKVEYSTGSDGSLMATTIKIGIATPNGSYFSTKETGPVTTIKQDTLVIDVKNGKLFGFHLAPDTRFERLGQKIPPANVRVGDTVKVKFDVSGDGMLVALSITVGTVSGGKLSFPKNEKGKVRTISATRLTVRTSQGKNVIFRVTTRTVFERNGRPVRRRFVKVGATVKIKYVKTSQGAKQALVVRLVPGR